MIAPDDGWWYLSDSGQTCFKLDAEPHPLALRFAVYVAHQIRLSRCRPGHCHHFELGERQGCPGNLAGPR